MQLELNMKLDKETIIAIVVCLAFLLAWPLLIKTIWPGTPQGPQTTLSDKKTPGTPEKTPVDKTTPDKPETVIEKLVPEGTKLVTDVTESVEKAVTEVTKPIEKPAPVGPTVKKISTVSLENDFIVATIDPNKGNVSSLKMKKYFTTVKLDRMYGKSDINIVLFEKIEKGALGISSDDNSWILTNVKADVENKGTPKESVTVKRTLSTANGQAFSVTQKWSIASSYVLESSVEITNLSNAPLNLTDVNLSAGGIPKITELAGDQVFREDFQIAYFDIEDNKIKGTDAEDGAGIWATVTGAAKGKSKQGIDITVNNKAKWIGVVNKYLGEK